LRPTIGWAPGEIVQDDAGWFVPPDAAPGMYRLGIVVYNPATGAELETLQKTPVFLIQELNVSRP
jgi:hypothetical protein